MGPHTTDTRYPEQEKERILAAVGDDWEVWYVDCFMNPLGHFSWSARPKGAEVSVLVRYSPDELIVAVIEYTEHLDEHLEAARMELAQTPDTWFGRIGVLSDRIKALESIKRPHG